MHYAGRLVIDAHGHLTTLYKPKKGSEDIHPVMHEVEHFDNSALCLYDMERYGVDMVFLRPSAVGTSNGQVAELVSKYPDKFRAFCSDMDCKLKIARGEATYSLDDSAAEVEAYLKTGNYIGIGEGIPRDLSIKKVYGFEERLNEWRTYAELARKYNVTLDFHEFARNYEWDCWQLLSRIAQEYPDVNIIVCHGGYSIGDYVEGPANVKKACTVCGESIGNWGSNIYLECGLWPAEYFQFALKDPNVGVTQLIWASDYGNVPQYAIANPLGDPQFINTPVKKWPWVLPYQTDFWGNMLHEIDKLRDWVTQDDINLILGGNAARLWKIPVPYERMFMCGRPDIWGMNWEQSIPFIPKEQVVYPD